MGHAEHLKLFSTVLLYFSLFYSSSTFGKRGSFFVCEKRGEREGEREANFLSLRVRENLHHGGGAHFTA